jgi:hypothetical protein
LTEPIIIKVNLDKEEAEHGAHELNHHLAEEFAVGELAAEALEKALEKVAEAFEHAIEFVKESIEASSQAQDAEAKLAQALAFRGRLTEEALEASKALSEEVSRQTILTVTQVRGIEAQLVQMGVSTARLKEATEAAIGLASVTGAQDKAIRQVAQAFRGEAVPALEKYGLTGRTIADTQRVLVGLFGNAQSQAETFSGRVRQLSNAWEELHVTLGDVITRSGAVNETLRAAKEFIESINKDLRGAGIGVQLDAVFRAMLRGLGEVGLSALSVGETIGLVVSRVEDWWDGFKKIATVALEIDRVINPFHEAISLTATATKYLFGAIADGANDGTSRAERFKAAWASAVAPVREALEKAIQIGDRPPSVISAPPPPKAKGSGAGAGVKGFVPNVRFDEEEGKARQALDEVLAKSIEKRIALARTQEELDRIEEADGARNITSLRLRSGVEEALLKQRGEIESHAIDEGLALVRNEQGLNDLRKRIAEDEVLTQQEKVRELDKVRKAEKQLQERAVLETRGILSQLVSVTAHGLAGVVVSAVQGGKDLDKAFANLGATVLTTIGEFMIAQGTAAVLSGLTSSVFGTPAAIAAGLAEIAGGTALVAGGTLATQAINNGSDGGAGSPAASRSNAGGTFTAGTGDRGAFGSGFGQGGPVGPTINVTFLGDTLVGDEVEFGDKLIAIINQSIRQRGTGGGLVFVQ